MVRNCRLGGRSALLGVTGEEKCFGGLGPQISSESWKSAESSKLKDSLCGPFPPLYRWEN